MIKELSDLGKKIREQESENKVVHDALKDEPISIDLIINNDGSFVRFEAIEKISRPAEAITAKKGKARLLLDKAEEVLGYNGESKKHELYLKKLHEYQTLKEIQPVTKFYHENKANGFEKARSCFEEQLKEKERTGNIAFRLKSSDRRIHEEDGVYRKIIETYEQRQSESIKLNSEFCSICGSNLYPIAVLHEKIKGIPPFDDGQSANRNLISFKYDAYQSYELDRGLNSCICTKCAKLYSEGLNWLLSPKGYKLNNKGEEKPVYPSRKTFGDTAMIFWTRDNQKLDEIDLFDAPDPGQIANLIDSIASGEKKSTNSVQADKFYSCTLSGAAARIAVRDWIEMSLGHFKRSIVRWFEDIAIERYDYNAGKSTIYYSRLYELSQCGKRKKDKNDTTESRIATHLWKAAIKGTAPPLWILNAVLKRVRIIDTGENEKKDSITPARAGLIRLIINRNNKGGTMIQEKLDSNNKSTAYVCGRIFSVLESIQRAALGKGINAGIRERYFSFASINPSPAFGRLMKMSQNHLTKLKGEKPGFAVLLDKELQGLFALINEFPAIFNLEEQGQFAIGYYHQKQASIENAKLRAVIADDDDVDESNDEGGEQ